MNIRIAVSNLTLAGKTIYRKVAKRRQEKLVSFTKTTDIRTLAVELSVPLQFKSFVNNRDYNRDAPVL